jgi:heme/copper-type cytochrome/quinol oxidase subunit 2
MAASVHYIKSHYRGCPARPPASRVPYQAAERRDTVFNIVMLAAILIIITVGVWLIGGVAAVGRSNNDCLQSARRVCGIIPHAPWTNRFN